MKISNHLTWILCSALIAWSMPNTNAGIVANSPEWADVIDAINLASAGETIIVPAGTATWTSSITLPRTMTLQGSGIGSTIINLTGNGIRLNNTQSRITGFTFISSATSTGNYHIQADCDTWFEVDHCEFRSSASNKQNAVHAKSPSGRPDPKGLVHNCRFINTRCLQQGDLGVGFGRDVWANPDRVPGTANTFFIEDCYFENTIGGNSVDNAYGGHYVFRYNTVVDSTLEAHGITSLNERGNKFVEIYNNKLVRTKSGFYRPMFIRGGTARVFNNIFTGPWEQQIEIDNETNRTNTGTGDSPGDGNLDATGYPWRDQIGTGTDAFEYTGSGPWPAQAFAPMYAWNNRHDGVNRHTNWPDNIARIRTTNGADIVAHENRDYFNEVDARTAIGYTPYPYPHPRRSVIGQTGGGAGAVESEVAYYVRAGASGNNDGSDWNNAYTALPATLKRGATYYVADGDYAGSTYTANDPESGSDLITLKKATAANHGISVGWQSTYGDGQAYLPPLQFLTGYFVIDGQVRNESDWSDGTPYGFQISTSGKGVRLDGGIAAGGVTLKYINFIGGGPDDNNGSNDLIYCAGGSKDLLIQRCRFYNAGRTHILMRDGQDMIVEYSEFDTNESTSAQHAQSWSCLETIRAICRYNVFKNIQGTGVVCWGENDDSPGSADDWKVYGNVVIDWEDNANGIFTSWTAHPAHNAEIFNNTIISCGNGRIGFTNNTGWKTYNNIFIDSGTPSFSGSAHTHNYNAADVAIAGEANAQLITQALFVDYAGGDYRLATATAAGLNTSAMAPGNDVDTLGNIRGADGNWDRGAFEFDASALPQVAAPTITPNGGTFGARFSNPAITLASATPDAEIRYTLDGSTPTESSFLYLIPFSLNSTATLKAVAFKASHRPSPASEALFIIDGTGPQVVDVYALANGRSIRVVFDENVSPDQAELLKNYVISDVIPVTVESLIAVMAATVNGNTVTLTTVPMTAGVTYTLIVNDMTDVFDNVTWSQSREFTYKEVENYSSFQTNYNIGAPEDDDDGDQLPNLLEYLAGLDPTVSDAMDTVLWMESDASASTVSFNFISPVNGRADLVVEIQKSSDMSTWTTIATRNGNGPWQSNPGLIMTPTGDSMEHVKVNEDLNINNRCFYRLHLQTVISSQ